MVCLVLLLLHQAMAGTLSWFKCAGWFSSWSRCDCFLAWWHCAIIAITLPTFDLNYCAALCWPWGLGVEVYNQLVFWKYSSVTAACIACWPLQSSSIPRGSFKRLQHALQEIDIKCIKTRQGPRQGTGPLIGWLAQYSVQWIMSYQSCNCVWWWKEWLLCNHTRESKYGRFFTNAGVPVQFFLTKSLTYVSITRDGLTSQKMLSRTSTRLTHIPVVGQYSERSW